MKAIETLDFQQEKQQNQIMQNSYKEIQKELDILKSQLSSLSSQTKLTKLTFQHNKEKMALKKRIDHQQQIKIIQNTIKSTQAQIQQKIQQSKQKYIPKNDKQIPIELFKQNTKNQANQIFSQVVQQVQKCYTSLGQINCVIQSLKDFQRKQNVKNKLKQLKSYLQKLSFDGKNIQLSKIQFLCDLGELQLFIQKNRKNLKLQFIMNTSNLSNSIKALKDIKHKIKIIGKEQPQIHILLNKKKQYETDFYQYYQEWLNLKSRLKGTSKNINDNISKLKQKLIQDETLFYQFDLIVNKSQKFLKNVQKLLSSISSLQQVEKCNFQLLNDYLQF